MNPEIKQQLYGGEITDYYPNSKKSSTPEQDNKNISNIYLQIAKKNNPLNLPDSIKNKITFLK
ncbi:MAG: hypothetical protein EBU90_11640 [Proteobacteria bacterium]|nr:hypothetical protein [Pseudomonadota bacterium]NBP14778.1 hypothetical protein [bacterium]